MFCPYQTPNYHFFYFIATFLESNTCYCLSLKKKKTPINHLRAHVKFIIDLYVFMSLCMYNMDTSHVSTYLKTFPYNNRLRGSEMSLSLTYI